MYFTNSNQIPDTTYKTGTRNNKIFLKLTANIYAFYSSTFAAIYLKYIFNL